MLGEVTIIPSPSILTLDFLRMTKIAETTHAIAIIDMGIMTAE
jgi:hypothetical protein